MNEGGCVDEYIRRFVVTLGRMSISAGSNFGRSVGDDTILDGSNGTNNGGNGSP